MHIIKLSEEIQKTCLGISASDKKIGFVPTMGCLHEGHISLIKEALSRSDKVVVSIFVNPLQFGKNEDFGSYPRPLERDLAICKTLGVGIAFCPNPTNFYPEGFSTRIDAGTIGRLYCGKSRPGFFDGVLTVVNILFNLVRPDIAFFGEKDFQQLFLIKQLVRDFRLSTQVIGCPIVRESSGLALSSRNEYLSQTQKREALCLSRAISAAKNVFDAGERSAETIKKRALAEIVKESSFSLDYCHVVSDNHLEEFTDTINGSARILLAGYIGDNPRVRLIDNGPLSEKSNVGQAPKAG